MVHRPINDIRSRADINRIILLYKFPLQSVILGLVLGLGLKANILCLGLEAHVLDLATCGLGLGLALLCLAFALALVLYLVDLLTSGCELPGGLGG